MDFLAGAKLLADRIGVRPAVEQVQVPADAIPVFHWCNVNPEAAPADGTAGTDPAPGARSV
jgi:hypothetical protein